MEKILISACLVGHRVRYDGDANTLDDDLIESWRRQRRLVAVCPEVLGGLAVPRPAAEIRGGDGGAVVDGRARLFTEEGRDVTEAFLAGARRALEIAKSQGVCVAVLKSRSPSCGSSTIYDGSFTGTRISGAGVTAALLRRNDIPVFSEEQLGEAAEYLAALAFDRLYL